MTLPVPGVTPGPVNVGDARTLVLAGGTAPREARKALYRELQVQAQQRGYFRVVDRTRDGWRLVFEGQGARLDGASVQMRRRSMAVRIDVSMWQAARPDAHDPQARVQVAVSIASASGALMLRERPYDVRAASLVDGSRDSPAAVEQLIAVLLDDISPVEVLRDVELEDAEPEQSRILQAAINGNVARAHEELRVYLENHPDSAAAAYNLGVLTEALGRYDDALTLYDRALARDNSALYQRARQACARSAEAAELTTEQ